MANSTRTRKTRKPNKPAKPYPAFPLYSHASKRWAKKIRGKTHFFGSWSDGPEKALERYLEQKDELHSGKVPRPKLAEGLTLADCCNSFLAFKRGRVDSGELSPRTFGEYIQTAKRMTDFFKRQRLLSDLRPHDFEQYRGELSKRFGLVRVGNEVQRTRCIVRYAFESGLIDTPLRVGPAFRRPTMKSMRIARHAAGPRMLEPAELRKIIKAAGVPLRAFVLLALNCGYGNSDCATLPLDAIDLDAGWVTFPRPKTGTPRRAKLWPETVKAIKAAIAERPTPRDAADAGLVFLTCTGRRWVKSALEKVGDAGEVKTTADDAIAKEMAKLLVAKKLKRPGVSFYALRHVFRTVADGARDRGATDYVMGHCDGSMASTYIERIDDARLVAVSEHVRGWLFGTENGTAVE